MRAEEHGKLRELAQGHTAGKWQSLDMNELQLSPKIPHDFDLGTVAWFLSLCHMALNGLRYKCLKEYEI
jgi:hypothetical protein